MQQTIYPPRDKRDRERRVNLPLIFPGYSTHGYPHGEVRVSVVQQADGRQRVYLNIYNENHNMIGGDSWTVTPEDVIPNHEERKL